MKFENLVFKQIDSQTENKTIAYYSLLTIKLFFIPKINLYGTN